MRKAQVAVLLALAVGGLAFPQAVLVQVRERSIAVDPATLDLWPSLSGTVCYQVPAGSEGKPDWGLPHSYSGVPLAALVDALGGMGEGDVLWVIGLDGSTLALPWAVVYGRSPLGPPILAFARDGLRGPAWPEGSELIFLAPDGEVSVEDQLSALGEVATAGLVVKAVTWIVVNWDGSSLPEVGRWPAKALLTLTAEGERTLTLREIETHFAAITFPGTYVTSAGRPVTALWTGISLTDLLGNLPEDTEIELVAADGYRMRYRYGNLSDAEGIWILAFKQDGKYMPFNPGYFRMVKVGPKNPRFSTSASAKMVVRVEVRGAYEPHLLRLLWVEERVFTRWELEVGVACPCRAVTVLVTHKGETRAYTGFPLWRLVAYVDDDLAPPQERGIYYDDAHFNDELAQAGYLVEIRGADDFVQTLSSPLLARDDRFIIALKVDGRFLTKEDGGPLLFVWDDSASAPAKLKWVKWVTEIVLIRD